MKHPCIGEYGDCRKNPETKPQSLFRSLFAIAIIVIPGASIVMALWAMAGCVIKALK